MPYKGNVEYGKLGYVLKDEKKDMRYLLYLKKQNDLLWQEHLDKQRELKYKGFESSAHYSTIETNKSLKKYSRSTMLVANNYSRCIISSILVII